jgi:glutaredoxin
VNDSPPVVYGAEWCKDCRRSKQLLTRLGVEHIDVDLEAEPDRATEAETLSGRKRIPVVHFADGLVLSEPSDDELERAVRERGLVPEGS